MRENKLLNYENSTAAIPIGGIALRKLFAFAYIFICIYNSLVTVENLWL